MKEILQTNLSSYIHDFVNSTGFHSGQVALIVGGFSRSRTKKIEASDLGKAMSAMVVSADGKQVDQSIDKRLLASFGQLSGKGIGDYIEVKGVQDADLFSITFDIATGICSPINPARCYQYIIFHPDQKSHVVQLPANIISLLEFRSKAGLDGEAALYEDAEILATFFSKVARENGFPSVGGHTLPLLQTPFAAVFPTGDIGQIKDGKMVKIGSFYVESGKIIYELEDGTIGEYRHLKDVGTGSLSATYLDGALI